jgi:WD40 repeat protein
MFKHELDWHNGKAHSAATSADGQLIASGGWDKTISIRHADTGKVVHVLQGLQGDVEHVGFSKDGTMVLGSLSPNCCSTRDHIVQVWKLNIGGDSTLLQTFPRDICSSIMQISPDGQKLAILSKKGVAIWSVQSGILLHELECHEDDIRSVGWSPDSKLMATGGCNQLIRVWDMDTAKQVTQPWSQGYSVSVVIFGADSTVLVSGDLKKFIKIWKLQENSKTIMRHKLEGHAYGVYSISLSPNGSLIASWSWDDTVRVWNLGTGKQVRVLEDMIKNDGDIAWSSDGQYIKHAVCAHSTVVVWRAGVKVCA